MSEIDECFGCDFNDPDVGCTMYSSEMWYACKAHGESNEELRREFEEQEARHDE